MEVDTRGLAGALEWGGLGRAQLSRGVSAAPGLAPWFPKAPAGPRPHSSSPNRGISRLALLGKVKAKGGKERSSRAWAPEVVLP